MIKEIFVYMEAAKDGETVVDVYTYILTRVFGSRFI